MTNTKGPLTQGSDPPGAPAAALMRDLAGGLEALELSRGGALPGLGLKLSCLRVGAERFTHDSAKAIIEPMIKQTRIHVVTVNILGIFLGEPLLLGIGSRCLL